MTYFKLAIRTLVLAGVVLGLTACAGLQMPVMDPSKALGPRPAAYCSETSGIYVQEYDLNPATKAAARVYGWFDMVGHAPKLEEPVVVILQDDDGKPAGVYVHEKGRAVKYKDWAAVIARYPEPCNLPRRATQV